MIQVSVRGIEKVHRMMARLPNEMNKEIGKDSEQFMKNTRKSAKLRAPRWTGALANSIKYAKKGKAQWTIVVDSPYGYFQEYGFRPHYVQLFRPTRSGFVVADWAASKGVPTWMGSIFVAKHKPFITPALQVNIAKLPSMLSQGVRRAITKARR